jgi:disulfide bond formation protein DsbB
MTRSLAITLNALGLYAIALILLLAFGAQLILHELPCPLCLLQRIQFAMLAVGPILNVRFGPRPSHYAVSLLTAAAGAAFASRQILLHVMPGDLGYGSALLGYHYYTWAFIGFAVAVVALAAMLCSTPSSKRTTRRNRSAASCARRCGWCWRSPHST